MPKTKRTKAEKAARKAEKAKAAVVKTVAAPTKQLQTVVFRDEPEPGQFYAKWSGRCKDCEEFFPKNSVIGYNEYDEIVCGDCWEPRYTSWEPGQRRDYY